MWYSVSRASPSEVPETELWWAERGWERQGVPKTGRAREEKKDDDTAT